MWDNPRLLNLLAGALVGIAGFAFALAAAVLLMRSALFPIREIDVVSPLKNVSKQDIEAAVQIRGNFFAVSPDEVRAELERLPWVRAASVRRVWPDRMEVKLEEHVALAHWGDEALVDLQGEKFPAKTDAALPTFVAPEGTQAEVTRRYERFAEILAPLGSPIERVVLTPRLAWQLKLANGLGVMLGRDADAAEARLRRFVGVYGATVAGMPGKHDYVDLRYPNGFALRVSGKEG